MHGGARSALLALALGATLGPATAALAQRHTQGRVAVAPFSGRRADEVRAVAVEALLSASGVSVVSDDSVAEAASGFSSAPERPADWARFARAARADAIVAGDVMVDRANWMAVLRARSATDGSIVIEERVTGHGPSQLEAHVRTAVADRIAPALARGAAAALPASDEAAPARERETVTEQDVEAQRREALDSELFPAERPSADDGPPRFSPLEARAGVRMFHRSLDFADTATPARPYELPLGPALSIAADWYPAAHFRNGALAHLGVSVLLEHALGIGSAGPDGSAYDTGSTRWGVGARYRLPLGEHEIAASVGYEHEAYTIDAPLSLTEPAFASVAYSNLRIGAQARLRVARRISLEANVAWLVVAGEGAIGSSRWFPDASAMGLDVSLGGSYAIGAGFAVVATIDFRQYMLDLGPGSGGGQASASATDRYIGGHLLASFTLDAPGGNRAR